MKNEGFEILEHPADLGIAAWGGTMAAAFKQAAMGLVSVILDPTGIEPLVSMKLRVNAHDRDQLLVKWLEEILYLYDARCFVPCSIEVGNITTTKLEAELRGEQLSPTRHEMRLDVKGITYHQLQIREDDGGARVIIYLDI